MFPTFVWWLVRILGGLILLCHVSCPIRLKCHNLIFSRCNLFLYHIFLCHTLRVWDRRCKYVTSFFISRRTSVVVPSRWPSNFSCSSLNVKCFLQPNVSPQSFYSPYDPSLSMVAILNKYLLITSYSSSLLSPTVLLMSWWSCGSWDKILPLPIFLGCLSNYSFRRSCSSSGIVSWKNTISTIWIVINAVF